MQSKQEFFSVCKNKLEPKSIKNRLSMQEIELLSSLYDTLSSMGVDWRFKGAILGKLDGQPIKMLDLIVLQIARRTTIP